MKKSLIKNQIQENKCQELARKVLSQWNVDAAGKVLDYAGQFRAWYARLKGNTKPAV